MPWLLASRAEHAGLARYGPSVPAEGAGGDVPSVAPERDSRSDRLIFWLAVGLVLLPLVVSAVHVLGARHIYNAGDDAGIELRTRDVGHHPVLLGLWSRSDWNHPGPALFYLLALPYRLAGSKPAGLQLGALLINGAAVLGMAVLARRRGGLALSLLTLLGCGLLLRGLGPQFVASPWNPVTPVLPFGFLVLLCWSLTRDDLWALPVAAGVASFCVQTHVGYLPLALPLIALGVGWLVIRARRSRPQDRSGSLLLQGRDFARASFLTAAIVGVMWLPPLLDQVLHRPGNLYRIARYFAHPGARLATLGDGFRVVAGQFALRPTWVTGNDKLISATEPALLRASPFPVLLVPLVLGGFVLWRRRSSDGAALVVTILIALVLGMLAVNRTVVPVYAYRLKWTWVLGMLGAVAIVWTAWLLAAPRYRQLHHHRSLAAALAIGGLMALGVLNISAAVHAGTPWKTESAVLAKLVPKTVTALPPGDGDVIVRTSDAGAIMYQGVQLALERRGIAARTDDPTGIVGNGSSHRVHRRGPVRAILTVATKDGINRTLAHADERLIAYSGPVSPRQRVSIGKKWSELMAQRPGTPGQRRAFIELVGLSKHLNGPEVAIFMVRRSGAAPRASQR